MWVHVGCSRLVFCVLITEMAFLSLRIREHVSPFKNTALWKILGKLGNWEFDLQGPQRAPPFFLFTWSSFAGSSLFQKGPGEGAGRPDPGQGPHVGTRPAGPVIPSRRLRKLQTAWRPPLTSGCRPMCPVKGSVVPLSLRSPVRRTVITTLPLFPAKAPGRGQRSFKLG